MLKFSLLGYGHIGKVHRKAIEATSGTELIAIIDTKIEEDNLEISTYNSLDVFLEKDTETDIVAIATPNGLHYQHSIQCLKAGKHVLIEKPIALSTKEANDIIETAKKFNKRVFSSMQLRLSPPVKFVKKLLESKKLGEIYMVNIHCYWNRNKDYYQVREWSGSTKMDGGVLFTQFSHFIDILNYWFEEVKCTHASLFNFNHQGIIEFADSGRLDFDAGQAKGSMIFSISTFEKNYKSGIIILAEKGTIEIGDQYLNQLVYCNMEEEFNKAEHSTDIKNFHPLAMKEIVQALNENRPSILDGEYAIQLVDFIQDAHTKAEERYR